MIVEAVADSIKVTKASEIAEIVGWHAVCCLAIAHALRLYAFDLAALRVIGARAAAVEHLADSRAARSACCEEEKDLEKYDFS